MSTIGLETKVTCNVLVAVPKLCSSFSVDVILDDEVVGCGTVVQRTPIVHNNPLLTTEAKLLIDSLVNESQSHPTYSCDIQVGGYTAWPTTGLEHHEL